MLKSKSSRWLAGPYLVWMAIFTVVPLFIVIWYAMTNADGQFTFDNLTQIGRYSSVFARSLILAAISTVICLVMAFPVGYFLSRLRANKQHIMLMLIMLPMWMNFLLRTYAWMTLLEKNGLINKFLGLFGLGPLQHDQHLRRGGAGHGVQLPAVYDSAASTPVMAKIDDSIIEAAQDLGATVWHILFRVLVPLTVPRHHHRHHHGVCARSLHLHYQPYAGRRLQPADRRSDRAAVPRQLLQSATSAPP